MIRLRFMAIFMTMLCLLLTDSIYAQEFVVKAVCIVPRDASQPNDAVIDRFKGVLKDVRDFYKQEMERHGYGSKTFRLEWDREGDPVIHFINGAHGKDAYRVNPFTLAKQDLPIEDNVYAVMIADIPGVEAGGFRGIGRITFDGGDCGGCRGDAVFAERNGLFEFSTLAHELGHAFGLWHNLKGQRGDTSLLMWLGDKRLDGYEARWLNKSPYFNRGFTPQNPPRPTSTPTFESFNRGGINFIRLNVDIVGSHPLYQAQVFRSFDHSVIAWEPLTQRQETVVFEIHKDDLWVDNKVFIHFIDAGGNQNLYNHPITIPLHVENAKSASAPKGNTAYLTLKSNHEKALVPQNSLGEWDGWFGLLWEKTPEGRTSPKPPSYAAIPSDLLNQWDYWFYAHAISRLVYDISDKNYTKFDCYFYMPNPCGSIASVELICFADGKEIYNSGVLRGRQARNKHISFDIPENSETFTITVMDAGDDTSCDHFLIANAYLAYSESSHVAYRTDVNGDGSVNIVDLVLVAARYGETITGSSLPNPDVNRDGIVDIDDIILIANELPVSTYSAPSLQSILTDIDLDSVYTTLPSTVAERGIMVLNHLFGLEHPVETRLLPNYPNPFNPETWIPYELEKPAEVMLTIYTVNGVLIRTLVLGHQSAGIYQDKKHAAYWDGKNEVGETVANGVYFYTLTAGDFTATRKMLIRK